MTGSKCIPVVGFDHKVMLCFTDEERLPQVSLCGLTLTLPRNINTQEKFNDIMTLSILGGPGVGLV